MWSVDSSVSNILTTNLARGLDSRDVLNGSDGTQGTRGAAEASHSNELLRVSNGGITFGRLSSLLLGEQGGAEQKTVGK